MAGLGLSHSLADQQFRRSLGTGGTKEGKKRMPPGIMYLWDGKMARQLGTLTALPENLGSIPSAQTVIHIHNYLFQEI